MIKENPSIVNRTSSGCSLLFITCRYLGKFSSLECLRLLLNNGADYNKHYYYGNSLHLVASYAKNECLIETVKLLVEMGCDINDRTTSGSVLFVLIERNTVESLECAQYLIDLDADLELVDILKRTCLIKICQISKNNMMYTILTTLIRLSDVYKRDLFIKTAYQYYEENIVLKGMLSEIEVSMLKSEYTCALTKSAANK